MLCIMEVVDYHSADIAKKRESAIKKQLPKSPKLPMIISEKGVIAFVA